jgi:tRNA-dihydrouridine synthase B
MGCPAKKVCQKLAGSALLRDESKVARILDAVVSASALPVTLKTRTGWDPDNRNGVRVAKIAENAGIQALAVHGRTRACKFNGQAEYATIRSIKESVSIPVIANGDIDSPEKAIEVLEYTGADAVMIGRGALGRPWIFSELNRCLDKPASDRRKTFLPVSKQMQRDIILAHLEELYHLYGTARGVRVGRKHLTWYCKYLEGATEFRNRIMRIESAADQLQLIAQFFSNSGSEWIAAQSDIRPGKPISAKEKITSVWKDSRT